MISIIKLVWGVIKFILQTIITTILVIGIVKYLGVI